MNNFNLRRRIILVFHQYGIYISGKKKFVNLYKDLYMDQIFVLGLIFELELVTGRKVEDEDAYSIQQPIEIIQKLILDQVKPII